MTIITPVYKDISIAELHNITQDSYNSIIVQVGRRNEPGAGKFSSVLFLTANERIARFNSKQDALQFIDDIQLHGLIEAMENESSEDSVEKHVETLQPTTETIDHKEFINKSGINDPLNLFINPQLELEKELQEKSDALQINKEKTHI